MSKFKVGDKVRTVEDIPSCHITKHTQYTVRDTVPYSSHSVVVAETNVRFTEDALELVPEVYLCDTCVNANVDCPIYPPKTCPSCVEYVEIKEQPKLDKEVITEMLSASISNSETKEFKVGFTGIFKPEHEWKSVASSIDGLAEVTPKYYNYEYKGIKLDPYRVMEVWGISHPAHQHAFKKLSRAGNKPGNELVDEIDEVIKSLVRWKEMILEDSVEETR